MMGSTANGDHLNLVSRRYLFEIHVRGHLDKQWSEWLGGIAVDLADSGETVLTGSLPDQSALIGLVNRLNTLNITWISARQLPVSNHGSADGLPT